MKTEDEVLKTSWTLVARIKNLDDRAHWREFYELYRGLITGVARRAGLREEEAEDVLQATMSSVSQNIGDFDANPASGSFHAWLLKLARWRILDQFKKRMPAAASSIAFRDSTNTTATIDRIPSAQEVDLDEVCDAEWKRQLLTQALEELQVAIKADHYQVFHLLAVEQKPAKEVARLLGKSTARIYVIKHRVGRALDGILKKLEKRLG